LSSEDRGSGVGSVGYGLWSSGLPCIVSRPDVEYMTTRT
jgi:hypothetical protein